MKYPEILCPVSAHAAFDKAADILGINIKHVPLDQVSINIKHVPLDQVSINIKHVPLDQVSTNIKHVPLDQISINIKHVPLELVSINIKYNMCLFKPIVGRIIKHMDKTKPAPGDISFEWDSWKLYDIYEHIADRLFTFSLPA